MPERKPKLEDIFAASSDPKLKEIYTPEAPDNRNLFIKILMLLGQDEPGARNVEQGFKVSFDRLRRKADQIRKAGQRTEK